MIMVRFGVFTDVHYAKGIEYGDRVCDVSLLKLRNIVNDFNGRNLDFCVCLGDIINSVQDFDIDKANIGKVAEEFRKFGMPSHIVLGNHDIEAMSKSEFHTFFGRAFTGTYYSFVHENSRFILLDANHTTEGVDFCRGNYGWKDANINKEQLRWLEDTMKGSKEENVIVFIHQDLDRRVYDGGEDPHLVDNYREVVDILERYGRRTVIIQGHWHAGNYQVINGIRYINLKALCVGNDASYIPRAVVTIDSGISIEYLE
jgi:alkaline phosphatase